MPTKSDRGSSAPEPAALTSEGLLLLLVA
jgi:hypothetical protein